MPKPEKLTAVSEMKELFEQSESFFITDYQGLNVADITVLRRMLRKGNVRYLVAKNTLLSRAAKEANKPGLDKYFKGPTAVAFALTDSPAAAKILNDSFKDKQLPRIKAFYIAEQIHGPDAIGRLADLPSRDALLAGVVGAVEAPFQQLYSTLDGFFSQLVLTVDALAEKRKGEGQ